MQWYPAALQVQPNVLIITQTFASGYSIIYSSLHYECNGALKFVNIL